MSYESSAYEFRGFHIPEYMMAGIDRYVNHKIPPGDFLQGIITNDLHKAVAHADDINMRNIPAYIGYFVNEAPTACWGSASKMKGWLKK